MGGVKRGSQLTYAAQTVKGAVFTGDYFFLN